MFIGSHPVTGDHCKEPGTILLMPAFEIFICINGIPSWSFLLWTKQAQLLQSLFIREILQIPNHLCDFCCMLSVAPVLSCFKEPRTRHSSPGTGTESLLLLYALPLRWKSSSWCVATTTDSCHCFSNLTAWKTFLISSLDQLN